MAAFSPLNWKELSEVAAQLHARLAGLFVDRVFVPSRERFPGGFVKNEWALRLAGKRGEHVLVFSVRARRPYLYSAPAKSLKAAAEGTRSAFDLALAKQLRGSRLERIEALLRERIVMLRFSGDAGAQTLALCLIPALPEAVLMSNGSAVIARTRAGASTFELPAGNLAPDAPAVRPLDNLREEIESSLDSEALELRAVAATRAVRDLLKQARERVRQSETALSEAAREPDWQRYGNLLKATLPDAPPAQGGFRELQDYATGETVKVPSDPKLDARAQVERFFNLARRRQRREKEAGSRVQDLKPRAERLAALLERPAKDWSAVERLESEAGITPAAGPVLEKRGKKGAWLGRAFVSKDGLPIWVGRSRDENLELTFKHARGNDVWLHLRGRPGAHVLIPLPAGKSAPLETLLDAATLTIHYSGGESWGKTEVDYTFKKHVKRIRDSTEASYTHNKTLIVAPDPARRKRLLGEEK